MYSCWLFPLLHTNIIKLCGLRAQDLFILFMYLVWEGFGKSSARGWSKVPPRPGGSAFKMAKSHRWQFCDSLSTRTSFILSANTHAWSLSMESVCNFKSKQCKWPWWMSVTCLCNILRQSSRAIHFQGERRSSHKSHCRKNPQNGDIVILTIGKLNIQQWVLTTYLTLQNTSLKFLAFILKQPTIC